MKQMHTLKSLTEKMLSREEALIYLAVESKRDDETYNDLGVRLGMSGEGVRQIYEKAKKKVDTFIKLGVIENE